MRFSQVRKCFPCSQSKLCYPVCRQPGVRKLEIALGLNLVAKHPNRFRLTPEGELAFIKGLEILKRASDFQECLSQRGAEAMGTLDFACTYSIAVSIIPKYLDSFRRNFPQVPINFLFGRKEAILEMLKNGTIDFGVVADEDDIPDTFEKNEIVSGDFGIYCSRKLKFQDAEKRGFILAEEQCKETIFFKQEYLRRYRKEPLIFMRVSSWEIIANFVAAGLGVGYLPDYIAESKRSSLQSCSVDFTPFRYAISAIYPRGMELRRSSAAFLSQF